MRHHAFIFFSLFFVCSRTLYSQQELTPLPLDKLNTDSLNKIIALKEKQKDRQDLAIIYGGIYNYYLYSSQSDSSLKYAVKAEENALAAGDSARYYFIELQRSDVFTNTRDFANAKDRVEKALGYYKRTKNYTRQANCLGALSYMYELKSDTAQQVYYLDLAEETLKISKDTFNIVGANDKRANILMGKNELDSAITLLNKNLLLLARAKEFGNSEDIRSFWKGWQLNKLADCYYRKKEYRVAIKYLKEALPYDHQTASFDAQNIFRYRFLINSYIQSGQKDSAVKYAEFFYGQTIKTLQSLDPAKIKEISAKYETERKERKITELEQKNRLQQLTVSSQRNLNIAFLGIFLIAIISGYLIIKNVREKRKIALEFAKKEMIYQEQLHRQKELEIRNRITRDLHDDIGSVLSSVKAYSEILKDNPDNPVIADLIRENSEEMIEKVEIIAWATNPERDTLKNLISKMQKFAAPLCHSKNIRWSIEIEGIDEEAPIPGEVRQNIFLVFKEALNNTIKYADATECGAKIFKVGDRLIFQMSDNGKGFAHPMEGNGLKNMKKRTEDLNGVLVVDSRLNKGTVVTMTLGYPFRVL
jgi:signal transduction histidine kinase